MAIIWKNVALYIVLIVVIALAVMYLLNISNFKVSVNALFAGFKLPNIDLTGLFAWITNNGALVGVVASLGTTALAYFIKNYQTNKLLNKATDELTTTQAKLTTATTTASKASALQKQLDELNGDTTLESLQKSILEKNTLLNDQAVQLKTTQDLYQKALDDLKLKAQVIEKVVYK
jgi:hypothetical protein